MPHPDDVDLLDSADRDDLLDGALAGLRPRAQRLGARLGQRPDPPLRHPARIFALLGISDEEAAAKFGFLLDAFRFGAPPHAGFAFGIDRLVALLAGEENIREVIAFPKTQSGTDPLTEAPDADRRAPPRASSACGCCRPRRPTEPAGTDHVRTRSDVELDDHRTGVVVECWTAAATETSSRVAVRPGSAGRGDGRRARRRCSRGDGAPRRARPPPWARWCRCRRSGPGGRR